MHGEHMSAMAHTVLYDMYVLGKLLCNRLAALSGCAALLELLLQVPHEARAC